jgi:DNA-directed RNA polymerase subunit RPC12/RpoP
MEEKRFQKNDDGFVCVKCGTAVPPNKVTSRDHCPVCLHSLHVDINPGDRKNPCGGVLVPISARPHPKKGFQIIYQCEKCKKTHINKAALTGEMPDDTDLLIRLTAKPTED